MSAKGLGSSLFGHLFGASLLHLFSIAMKVGTTFLWLLIDSARFLGYFALLGVPGGIAQQAQSATSLAWAAFPRSDRDEEARIFLTALLIDLGLMCATILVTALVFAVTRAPILGELGWGIYALACGVYLAEPFTTLASYSAASRGRTGWFVALNNARPLALAVVLGILFATRSFDIRAALFAFLACAAASVLAAAVYVRRFGIRFLSLGLSRSFIAEIQSDWRSFAAFRLSRILFSSLVSFYLAHLPNAASAGQFSFAWTLSNFVYFAMAPVIEQTFGPRISMSAGSGNTREAIALADRALAIALGLGGALAAIALVSIPWIFKLLGKTAFEGSVGILAPLIGYQVAMAGAFGYNHILLCRRRYTGLTGAYLAATASASVWLVLAGSGAGAFLVLGTSLLLGSILLVMLRK